MTTSLSWHYNEDTIFLYKIATQRTNEAANKKKIGIKAVSHMKDLTAHEQKIKTKVEKTVKTHKAKAAMHKAALAAEGQEEA